jgi:SMODS and SLOG-associating 2TM effector domain 1
MASMVNADSSQQAWCQGRIPLHLRVGVTGHRFIDQHDDALMTAVGAALDRIERHCRKGTAATPVNLTVVSALAEGADRIVARAAIGRGAILEVVLPLPLDDYLTDFESDKSRSEFCSLLVDHASAITELPPADGRDAAYERAGRAIVDRSDVLLALWDGRAARGRGGTAEIVSYARRHGVPILQVTVERLDPGSARPRTVHEPELPARFCLLSGSAFKQLDRYNSTSLRAGREGNQPSLLPPNLALSVPPHVQSIVNYAQPYFHRAERMARRSQRIFTWLTRLLYSLAAGAVILVATQVIFFGHDPQIVWAEVVALATVVVVLVVGKRAGFHDRWLTARSLAERIRSGVFLAAVGTGQEPQAAPGPMRPTECDQPDPGRKRLARAAATVNQWARDRWAAVQAGARRLRARASSARGSPRPAEGEMARLADPDPNQEWVERAFREIYWRARRSPAAESDLPGLKELVTKAWINGQAAYHTRVFRRLTRRQRQLGWLAVILFGVSALVALFHSTGVLESASGPDVWGYCSVVIPAVGAAIAGYSAQREYARIAERSRQMVLRLQDLREQVEHSHRLSSLQQAVGHTEMLMRTDTAEWYEVVRLHDLEVPAG